MRFLITLLCALLVQPAYADNTTAVGRAQYAHPNLGHTPGAPLYTHINDLWTKVSDDVSTRYKEYTGQADSTTVTYTHNLGEPFADIVVVLYSGTGTSKTRIADPAGSGWTIAAGASPTTQVDVTTPASGAPHDFSIEIYGSLKGMAVQSPAAVSITGGTLSGVTLTNPTATGFKAKEPSGSDTVTIDAPSLSAPYVLTLPADDGGSGQVLATDGSGVLSWASAATVPASGAVYSNGTALQSEAELSLSRGGTAKNLTATNGGLIYSDADSLEVTSAGTASQWVLSGGAGAPTMTNTTTTGKTIDGSADEIQLTVQGNAPPNQTSPLVVVENSAGTDYVTVTGAGNVGIGSSSPTEKLVVTDGQVLIESAAPKTRYTDNGGSPRNLTSTAINFVTSGTGTQTFLTLAANSTTSGSMTLATCDGSNGSISFLGEVRWACDGDSCTSVATELVDAANSALACSTTTCTITPSGGTQNEWCLYGWFTGTEPTYNLN